MLIIKQELFQWNFNPIYFQSALPVLDLAGEENQQEVETSPRLSEEQMQAGEMSPGKWH